MSVATAMLSAVPGVEDAPSGPLYEIGGLPVHPLVVHAAVVLVPLGALGLIAIFAIPKLRRSLGWLVLLCLGVGVGGAWLSKESGEQLAAAVGLPARHADLADQLTFMAIALLVLAVVWYFAAMRGDRKEGGRSTLALVLGIIMVILSLLTLTWTVLVGHSGAEAVWQGELPPAGGTPSASASASPSASGSYTMAQVTAHSATTDCWTVVDGNVYDLTDWEAKHPGGAEPIDAMCGKDATSAFRGQHGSQSKPNKALADYQIGTLAGAGSASPAASDTAAAQASPSSSDGTYTMADVAAHASAADCWSVVSNKVYDLTGWEDKHPGGAKRIIAMCGVDATSAFRDEHGNQGEPNQALAEYQIGTLG